MDEGSSGSASGNGSLSTPGGLWWWVCQLVMAFAVGLGDEITVRLKVGCWVFGFLA